MAKRKGTVYQSPRMNQTADVERLAHALTALAYTITEIVRDSARVNSGAQQESFPVPSGQKVAPGGFESLLTKNEVAERAKVSVRTVDNWIRTGFVPYYKLGRTVRFKGSELQQCWDQKCRVLLRRQRR